MPSARCILSLLVSGAAASASAAPDDAPIAAAWRLAVESGVEWAEPCGDDALLVCTRQPALLVIDAGNGAPRGQPRPLNASVRFAGCRAGLAIVHDRFELHALTTVDGAAAWSAGGAPATTIGDVADPENTPHLVGAAVAGASVFVLRSDGLAAVIDAKTGASRRTLDLPRMPQVRMRTLGSRVSIVGRDGGKSLAIDLDLDDPRPPRTLALRSPPLLEELTPAGLVIVESRRAVLWRPDGRLDSAPLPFPIARSAVALHGDGAAPDAQCWLWAADARGELTLLPLHSGGGPARTIGAAPPRGGESRLSRDGEWIIQERSSEVLFHPAGRQGPVVRCEIPDGARLISAHAGESAAFVLCSAGADASPPRLGLRTRGLSAGAAAAQDSAIDVAARPRNVLWRSNTVIVVSSDAIAAYALPSVRAPGDR